VAAEIRPARPEEFSLLGPLEEQAGERFEEIGILLDASVSVADRGEVPLAVLVAGDPPVGFAWLNLVCGAAHLEELAVLTSAGRRGLGRALVEASCDWAEQAGYASVTLCTYHDVPWNGPFYRSAGFVELEPDAWCPELAALRATERANGLDDFGRRAVMIRRLGQPRTT
jgi:GNAT superfamily N-acetyltransferase